MRITRKFNKKSPIYYYSIYIINTWSVLVINNPTLRFIYYFKYTIRLTCYRYIP